MIWRLTWFDTIYDAHFDNIQVKLRSLKNLEPSLGEKQVFKVWTCDFDPVDQKSDSLAIASKNNLKIEL